MSFALDLRKFADKAGAAADSVIRVTVIEIGKRIVEKSPVGDADYWIHKAPPGYVGGRFRANWQYGFGTQPQGVRDAVDPEGRAVLAALTTAVASGPAVGIHYIVNNLPYAKRIEDGWSKRQAPRGVVGLTVLEFKDIVEGAARS